MIWLKAFSMCLKDKLFFHFLLPEHWRKVFPPLVYEGQKILQGIRTHSPQEISCTPIITIKSALMASTLAEQVKVCFSPRWWSWFWPFPKGYRGILKEQLRITFWYTLSVHDACRADASAKLTDWSLSILSKLSSWTEWSCRALTYASSLSLTLSQILPAKAWHVWEVASIAAMRCSMAFWSNVGSSKLCKSAQCCAASAFLAATKLCRSDCSARCACHTPL